MLAHGSEVDAKGGLGSGGVEGGPARSDHQVDATTSTRGGGE
jgi:hypothetical protein